MFDVIETTLASAVASAGTFTVGYATNRSAGDYTGGHAHKMQALGANFTAPNDFTVSFDASVATITYNGSTTLPAGTDVILQFDRLGSDLLGGADPILPKSMRKVETVVIDLGSPDADDANGYVESQDLTAAGVFSVDTNVAGALAAAALNGTADVPRNVVAAWTGTAVLTVTGTDVDGNVLVESSASGTSLTGKKAFKTVTNISTSANITALTVGTGDVLGLPVFISEGAYVRDEFEDGVSVGMKPHRVYVPFQIDQTDLLAGTPISVPSPVAGTIKRVITKVWKAVGTGGDITMKVNNTSVDGLTVTIADSAAAGDTDSDTPTAGHASTTVAVDDELELIPAAAFATTGAVTGYIEILTTGVGRLQGTLVAGVTSKATATTGDVRGTYSPATGPDGSTAFALMMALPDPGNDGVPQYAG